jgi:glycosyltransferase involved in cell wall biosynthesis
VFCELFPDADLYTLFYFPDRVSPTIRSMNVHASWLNRLPGVGMYYRYGLPLFPEAIESFALRDYDLILSSSHCVAKGAAANGALHVSYVHSPMRYVWDMHEAYFGRDGSRFGRVGMVFWRGYLQRWDVRSAERVHHFIANSEHVAGKIRGIYKREANVIYPPVDLEKFHIDGEPDSYYLIVAGLVPYKNVQLAIAAFNHLKLPLRIVGEGPLKKSLQRQSGPSIEFLGRVDNERLAELYARCEALVFPGEEDFGIVPLEAQASGRPVIAYGRGGVKESVVEIDDIDCDGKGGPTGIFFMEATIASLVEAIARYQSLKWKFEPSLLRRHASRFSRGVFKSLMEQYIEEKLRDRIGIESRDVETA